MASEPRTLFVIINDQRLVVSEPHTTLFHDQWFIKDGFTDENMARRFLDMHVRGYYKNGKIYFYRCPTFIFDDRDIEVMCKNIDDLLVELKNLDLVKTGDQIELIAGRGHNEHSIKIYSIS